MALDEQSIMDNDRTGHGQGILRGEDPRRLHAGGRVQKWSGRDVGGAPTCTIGDATRGTGTRGSSGRTGRASTCGHDTDGNYSVV